MSEPERDRAPATRADEAGSGGAILRPGDVIDNATVSRLFRVANSGGMRRSLDMNHLVLVADRTKRGVRNRWEDGVLHYVGQGQGDQSLDRGNNRALARSPQTGEAVHLLEVREPGRYAYRGRVELAGEPYEERQRDAAGRERTVIMFPLRLVAGAPQGYRPPPAVAPAATAHLPPGAYAVVRGPIDPAKLPQVNALLEQLRALGVDVVDQRDVDREVYEEALGRSFAAIEDELRRAARRLVAETRATRTAAGRRWGLTDDEVAIDDHAGHDRIREVLDVIGRGDEFGRLRLEAERGVEMPDLPPNLAAEEAQQRDEQFAELERQVRRRDGW